MRSPQAHRFWHVGSLAIAGLIIFPIVTLVWLSFSTQADDQVWRHLSNTVLNGYIVSTLSLMIGVAVVSLLLGVGSAYLVTQYQFVGVGFFHWALILPLAMPSYIIAYSYTGLLDVAGPVQSYIRSYFDLSTGEYWFPPIRSLGGAIFVLSFVLYPYIYLLTRTSFIEQSSNYSDAARLLGMNRMNAFYAISLRIARPTIIAGLSLVLMETIADYGTVSYFGINTFTTGIFRTWYGLNSIAGAAQLALLMMAFVATLIIIEKYFRSRAKYYTQPTREKPKKIQLVGYRQQLAILLCCLPILIGFVIPVIQLLAWALAERHYLLNVSFWLLVKNTVLLASITTLIALILALFLAYSHRITRSASSLLSNHIVSLGYAIPGTVIAIGVLVPLARFDNTVDAWFRQAFNFSTGLLISGTIAALVIAYLARFLAVALNTVNSNLSGIATTMDDTSRSLGFTPKQVLRHVHIPLLRTGLLTAILLVFVDVMKELPATLILRPFNFDTLAVKAYELASDEQLSAAALPSLAIVLAGLIPVILLSNVIQSTRKRHS